MGTYYTKDADGKVNKDFNPSAAMGRKFYKVYSEWDKLTKEEKAATQIFG